MKLIHCADIHLGSKMEARLPREKAVERRRELRASFDRMLEIAREEGVSAILLAGDVFDSDRPLKTDKEFFYNAVKGHPDILFFYLRGNHDNMESYRESPPENLKTFGEAWTSYDLGEVVITGAEGTSPELAATLMPDAERKNIILLHGGVGTADAPGAFNLTRLRGKGVDYLALGHYHSFAEHEIDARGVAVYAGCLEGRGFDEPGEKGFVLLETTPEGITHRLIPVAKRTVRELTVDVTPCESLYEACLYAERQIDCPPRDLLRVVLVGEVSFPAEELAGQLTERLTGKYYFVSVKDRTLRRIDPAAYVGDVSLRGEFVRTVLASGYTEEEQNRILNIGLRVLDGREAEA